MDIFSISTPLECTHQWLGIKPATLWLEAEHHSNWDRCVSVAMGLGDYCAGCVCNFWSSPVQKCTSSCLWHEASVACAFVCLDPFPDLSVHFSALHIWPTNAGTGHHSYEDKMLAAHARGLYLAHAFVTIKSHLCTFHVTRQAKCACTRCLQKWLHCHQLGKPPPRRKFSFAITKRVYSILRLQDLVILTEYCWKVNLINSWVIVQAWMSLATACSFTTLKKSMSLRLLTYLREKGTRQLPSDPRNT